MLNTDLLIFVINSISVVNILSPWARQYIRSQVTGISRLFRAAKLQSTPGATGRRHDTLLGSWPLAPGSAPTDTAAVFFVAVTKWRDCCRCLRGPDVQHACAVESSFSDRRQSFWRRTVTACDVPRRRCYSTGTWTSLTALCPNSPSTSSARHRLQTTRCTAARQATAAADRRFTSELLCGSSLPSTLMLPPIWIYERKKHESL